MRVSTIIIVAVVIGGGVYFAHKKGYIGRGGQAVEQSFDVHYQKGQWLFTQGKFAEAIPELEKAYELEPRSDDAPACLVRIGDCYRDMKEPAKALEYYNRTLAEFPNYKLRGQVEQTIEKTKALGGF